MKRLLSATVILSVAFILLFLTLFGTSALNNIHLKYLRNLGNDTILIHSLTGAGATGFMVKGRSGNNYVMTNSHVCELEAQGVILGVYKDHTYILKVIKRYALNDLCVMSAPSTVNKVFRIAKTYDLGGSAYAIGYPLLEPLSLSLGELSDLTIVNIVVKYDGTAAECVGPTYEYVTDELPATLKLQGMTSACVRSVSANTSSIIILPGNSGSPVVDMWGAVIGVAFATNEYSTRSYVVPLSDLKDFLNDL